MKPFSPLLFDSTRNRGKQFLNELISTFYFRGFIVRLLRSGSATDGAEEEGKEDDNDDYMLDGVEKEFN